MIELPTEREPVRILAGDCLESLRALPDDLVHCCVTSPPYYGLRDYGHAGQIGLEPTPAEYVARLVAVFDEVRRVLRPDGTLWLNLGDSYSVQHVGRRDHGAAHPTSRLGPNRDGIPGGTVIKANGNRLVGGYKPKDLLGIPWRVAFALQDAGWYLRQDIIWAKPNPMPESVRDRCTKAHEYLFLLSKNARYYFDAEAIAEPFADERMGNPGAYRWSYAADPETGKGVRGAGGASTKLQTEGWNADGAKSGRNRRSVWTVTPDPYPGAHFAVMPPELVRPCVLAGSPVGGAVLDPFAGSGTALAVAREENRLAVGCELNPEYVKLIRKRLARVTPRLFTEAQS